MSFHIILTTYEQIKTFVSLAARQSFDIRVGNDRQTINGKDFMGMCSLDFSRPLNVQIDCSAEEAKEFCRSAMAIQN